VHHNKDHFSVQPLQASLPQGGACLFLIHFKEQDVRIFLLIAAILVSTSSTAEPFLAVENGFHCVQCHINPAGGGSRNKFGALFSQTQLPATVSPSADMWSGGFNNRFSIGGDLRFSGRQVDIDDVDDNLDFATDRITLYAGATLNQYVSFYLDQQVAPGGSINREAWVKLQLNDNVYVRAGKMFLPFGLRLEDDSAYIRQLSNINFNTPDNGVEIGFIKSEWRFQLAASNGTAGAAEIDDGKQVSFLGSYVQPKWRIGISLNENQSDDLDRTMTGVFAGMKTGPVTWLLEYDLISDSQPGLDDSDKALMFAEANISVSRGHYLKFTAEKVMEDISMLEDQDRLAIEYQYFPIAFTQFRLGVRKYDSDNPDPFFSRDEIFAQLHVFF
jgi:hypothetical protein